MIVRQNKGYETNSNFPNTNWYEHELENYVVDETTPEGHALAEKIIQNYPYYEFVIENGELVDVIPTERPPAPTPPKALEEVVSDLQKENNLLRQQVAQVNGDFGAFTDFYFSKFPDQL